MNIYLYTKILIRSDFKIWWHWCRIWEDCLSFWMIFFGDYGIKYCISICILTLKLERLTCNSTVDILAIQWSSCMCPNNYYWAMILMCGYWLLLSDKYLTLNYTWMRSITAPLIVIIITIHIKIPQEDNVIDGGYRPELDMESWTSANKIWLKFNLN